RNLALALLGQSQAYQLHGDLPVSACFHAVPRSKRPRFLAQPARRRSWDSRSALAASPIGSEQPTDRGGYFHARLSIISEGGKRLRFRRDPPGNPRLAEENRGPPQLARPL